MKKVIEKEKLEQIISESHSYAEVIRKLGYSDSFNVAKRIKKQALLLDIDCSHFSPSFTRRKYNTIEVKCPFCLSIFQTPNGGKKAKTYCSRRCCNSLNLGDRHSEGVNKKIALKLTKPDIFRLSA